MTSDVDPTLESDADAGLEETPESEADAGVDERPRSDPDAGATACTYTEYPAGTAPEDLPATGADAEGIEARVWDALSGVEDPEMPISIVDLGLVYGVDVADGHATVRMTLTYTGCPARTMLTRDVETAVADVAGVESAAVELVWSPEWSVEMVTDDGKEDLRAFGLSV